MAKKIRRALLWLVGAGACYFFITKWMFHFALVLCCALFGVLMVAVVLDRKIFFRSEDGKAKLGELGPIIISFAAFALAYQQAEILVRQENERIAESRPYLFFSRIDSAIDISSDLAKISLKLYNSGKSPGSIIRQRVLTGFSEVTSPEFGSVFSVNWPADKFHGSDIKHIFPLGDVSFVPVVRLDKTLMSALRKGKPVAVAVELDYCEVNRKAPRCFTLHFSFSFLFKNGEMLHESTKHMDLMYEKESADWNLVARQMISR